MNKYLDTPFLLIGTGFLGAILTAGFTPLSYTQPTRWTHNSLHSRSQCRVHSDRVSLALPTRSKLSYSPTDPSGYSHRACYQQYCCCVRRSSSIPVHSNAGTENPYAGGRGSRRGMFRGGRVAVVPPAQFRIADRGSYCPIIIRAGSYAVLLCLLHMVTLTLILKPSYSHHSCRGRCPRTYNRAPGQEALKLEHEVLIVQYFSMVGDMI